MEDMSLYEINSLLARLLSLPNNDGKYDEETGEYFDVEALKALDMKLEEKIEGCLLWNKNQRALSKALREEAEKLIERADEIDSKVERSDKFILFVMKGKSFVTSKVKATVSETTSCPDEINMSLLPPKYIKYTEAKTVITPASRKVNKAELLKDLRKLRKDNQEPVIAGVELQVKSKLKYE